MCRFALLVACKRCGFRRVVGIKPDLRRDVVSLFVLALQINHIVARIKFWKHDGLPALESAFSHNFVGIHLHATEIQHAVILIVGFGGEIAVALHHIIISRCLYRAILCIRCLHLKLHIVCHIDTFLHFDAKSESAFRYGCSKHLSVGFACSRCDIECDTVAHDALATYHKAVGEQEAGMCLSILVGSCLACIDLHPVGTIPCAPIHLGTFHLVCHLGSLQRHSRVGLCHGFHIEAVAKCVLTFSTFVSCLLCLDGECGSFVFFHPDMCVGIICRDIV